MAELKSDTSFIFFYCTVLHLVYSSASDKDNPIKG